ACQRAATVGKRPLGRECLPVNSCPLESHHGIVKEILALELPRREQIGLACKFMHQLVTRTSVWLYTLPCLPSMVDIKDSRRFGLRLLSDLFLNSFHSELGVALRMP